MQTRKLQEVQMQFTLRYFCTRADIQGLDTAQCDQHIKHDLAYLSGERHRLGSKCMGVANCGEGREIQKDIMTKITKNQHFVFGVSRS